MSDNCACGFVSREACAMVRAQQACSPKLCHESVSARKGDPNDFPGRCIRVEGHRGKCQKINNGMTQAEALAITNQDLPEWARV